MANIAPATKKHLAKIERENIELKTRLEIAESNNKWVVFAPILNRVIVGGVTVSVTYFIYKMVEALAGKTTFAYIFTTFLANIGVQAAITVSLVGASFIYAWYQKDQRRKTTERLHKRIKELEEMIDPERSSSGLTTKGDTNPLDK